MLLPSLTRKGEFKMTTGTDCAARFAEEGEQHRALVEKIVADKIRGAIESIMMAKVAFAAGGSAYPVSGLLSECRYEAKFCSPISTCLDRENVRLLERLAADHGVSIDWRFVSENTTYDLGRMYHYEAFVVPTNGSWSTRLRKLRAWFFD